MAPATDNSVPVLSESRPIYRVVAFALDLTGKKLIDEICHISACHEDGASFDQYIMTYRDISRSSIRSHGIRIFTMLGKYRVLKDTTTMKSIHTKSEYSALNDFIEWLSQQKGNSEGVVLAYHDNGLSKVTPFLMEALERYKLTDEFFKSVKGFVNCCNIASSHPDVKGRSLALRSLARRLLGEEKEFETAKEKEPESEDQNVKSEKEEKKPQIEDVKELDVSKEKSKEISTTSRRGRRASRDKSGPRDKEREKLTVMQSAKFRALTTYKLLQKFTTVETNIFEDEIIKHLTGRDEEDKNLTKQRELAQKVRSLRPIFVGHIRTSPKDRSRAVLLRRYLIEAELDYETLKNAYETGSTDAIVTIVEKTSAKKRKQHQDELVELIVSHFRGDPQKDVNSNDVKPGVDGAGDHADTGSSTESDSEEFEEANADN
ncbi:unnamed protein product [Allacma fusca]|uniref:Maternal protein exuperantia n=1 Tax=Allacma fusca TaxID=39272 RepID=A0A8J2JC71_9HEXA|nr:unnamed protein product [Allacma fusca]